MDRVLTQIDVDRLLLFRLEPNRPSQQEARRRFRRAVASITFYHDCFAGRVEVENNGFLDWMRDTHPQGWQGARSEGERVLLCRRYRDLLFDIQRKGVVTPIRLVEPLLFGLPGENKPDGGNRLYISHVLGLQAIPCLVLEPLLPFAEEAGLVWSPARP